MLKQQTSERKQQNTKRTAMQSNTSEEAILKVEMSFGSHIFSNRIKVSSFIFRSTDYTFFN